MTNDVNDEITLKELILTIQEYWYELWRSWWKIGLITIPFILYFLYITYTTPPTYTAEIKYFVEGEGGGGGLGGLLGSFGIKTGSGKNNPYQILEVLGSNKFMTEVLFTKDENNILLVNKIIESNRLNNILAKSNPEFEGFKFKNDSIIGFDLNEKNMLIFTLSRVKTNLIDDPLVSFNYDEDKGFYTISAHTNNEEISYLLAHESYKGIKEFFENKTMVKYQETRDLLKNKVDSLENLIKSKMYQVGKFGDSNRSLQSLEKLTQRDVLQREVSGLSFALSEALKTYEISDFNLKNQNTLFMLIDEPFIPLPKVEQSPIINIIKGIIFGVLFGSILILIFKIYKKALYS